MDSSNHEDDEDSMWDIGVYDAHCHPTDIMASIDSIAGMNASVLTVMSTRSQDQDLVAGTARNYKFVAHTESSVKSSPRVVPAFGWHPWFSHQLYDDRVGDSAPQSTEHYKSVLVPAPEDKSFMDSLPQPRPLQEFLRETESRLKEFPFALVGEVGLDRSFRLPDGRIPASDGRDLPVDTRETAEEYTPGSREGRPLTPYRVSMSHQKLVLRAQLELAAKYDRPVSVHSVQAHGVVFEVLQSMWKGYEKPSKRESKRKQDAPNAVPESEIVDDKGPSATPFPRRICMHSYSGPPDALRQFLANNVPAEVYFSFSTAINFSNASSDKVVNVIKAVPGERILIESDLHCAGKAMDDLLRDIVKKVCEIKEWSLEAGTRQLKSNWHRMAFSTLDFWHIPV